MLIEANTNDAALAIISTNGNGRVIPKREVSEPQIDGDRHVFGLMANDCKLLNGFRYYDETRGWPLNPSAKRKKYLTFSELFAIKENLIAALEFEIEPPARKQVEQAKRLVLRALGEIESE